MDSVSEGAEGTSQAASAEAGVGVGSIGTYLAGQRELRGISIEELATQTRIPLRSLQRLEAGAFDGERDGFVRGFVRTVAEALGLDPEETLARTLVEPSGSDRRAAHPRLSLRRALMVAGLLVGAAGIIALLKALPLAAVVSRDAQGGSYIMIRRDPVRALAEAQGGAAHTAGPVVEELRREP